MGRWAQPKVDRDQIVLFAPTLDAVIAPEHPVRLFEETLQKIDFSLWEQHYVRVEGQPPIHPRILAAVILYGLSLGIRSSRKLEDATANRLDFLWLCSARTIDHSTLAGFRTRFESPLKDLFKRIGRVAIELGMVNLNQIALDGTAKRANNSRYATARRPSLQQKLAALDQQIQQLMQEAHQADQADAALYGESSPTQLPRQLKNLQQRQARLSKALERLEELDRKREGRKDVRGTAAVPTTDPHSAVLPNKAGGHAPNYTLVLATEGQSGLIVDSQVLGGNGESGTVLAAVDHVRENFGQKPGQLLADSGFNSGPNLQALQEQGVEALMPARQEPCAGTQNPAVRADPQQPVPPQHQEQLPINPQRKVLDRGAFVYHAEQDRYYCPMGRVLSFVGMQSYRREGTRGQYRVYECGSCGDCPLASRCLSGKRPVRRVVRDEYEPLREAMARRLASVAGKAAYKRRSFLSETPFAVWNTVMNFRQLLLRGLQKVAMEVSWMSSAYNLRKIVAFLGVPHVGV